MPSSNDTLQEAGFTDAQVEALELVFAKKGHAHEMEDVMGLPEALQQLDDDDDLDEDEDE